MTVSNFPLNGSSAAVVRAEDQTDASIFDQVPVTVWASSGDATSSNGGSDVVEASHDANAVPEVAIVEKNSSGVCSWDKAVAFVGAAAVGEHNKPCSVALLSGTHSMHFEIPATTSGWNAPKAKMTVASSARLPLHLSVFIAVTARTASALSGVKLTPTAQLTADVAQAAEAQAKVDVDWANMIFEATRVGLKLNATYTILPPTTIDLPLKVGADPFDCDAPRHLPDNAATASWYDQNTVTVYYVDWVDYPTDPLDPGSRGAQCYYLNAGVPGPVIFVSYTRHSTATLAHELGHAFALEHADMMGVDNVMNSLWQDGPLGASARSHFTLGQAFRMNVSDESWMNNSGPRAGPQRSCGIVGRCPPIDFDVR